MTLNTENSSAKESVNTRPRWKAYFDFIGDFFAKHQQKLALVTGFALVALLFFNLGRFSEHENAPEVRVQEPNVDLTEIYDNLKSGSNQFARDGQSADGSVAGTQTGVLNCGGKIKGNVSSSGKVYHLPGGAFYARTVPEICFTTETEAQVAGFRKSSR